MAEETKLSVKTGAQPALVPAQPGSLSAFDTLRSEIDRVFEGFGVGNWHWPFGRPFGGAEPPALAGHGWALAPAVDVIEKDAGYEIAAELPGLDEKDIEVGFANGVLTIKGEKKDERQTQDEGRYVSERRYGAFARSFRVPDGVDADGIEANFVKGVLNVKLPKLPQARNSPKTIPVKGS